MVKEGVQETEARTDRMPLVETGVRLPQGKEPSEAGRKA